MDERRVTGTNRHNWVVLEDLSDAIPPIMRPSSSRRMRAAELHAGKAGDVPRCRGALTRCHTKVRIARKGIEPKERLGRHHWVVERTLAWLERYRCLTIRYESRNDIRDAILSLGCALICHDPSRRD